MIYKESNYIGDIEINKTVVGEIVTDALSPWLYTGKLKLQSNREINSSLRGVYVCMHVSIAFGESINGFLKDVCEQISSRIINSLEMPVDDIVIVIDSMFTKKGSLVQRNIEYKYSANKN